MFSVCVGLVFRSEYVQFPIICSLQYSININTVEVDPHSDLLHFCIVKPKNSKYFSRQRHSKNMTQMFDVGEMGHRDEVLRYYKLLQRIILKNRITCFKKIWLVRWVSKIFLTRI